MSQKSYNYYYIQNNTILVRCYVGEFSICEIMQTMEDDVANGAIHASIKGVINDCRGINLNAKLEDAEQMCLFCKKTFNKFEHIKIAVVTDSAKYIVIPKFFELQHPDVLHGTFTTIESAVSFINKRIG